MPVLTALAVKAARVRLLRAIVVSLYNRVRVKCLQVSSMVSRSVYGIYTVSVWCSSHTP